MMTKCGKVIEVKKGEGLSDDGFRSCRSAGIGCQR